MMILLGSGVRGSMILPLIVVGRAVLRIVAFGRCQHHSSLSLSIHTSRILLTLERVVATGSIVPKTIVLVIVRLAVFHRRVILVE